METLQLSDFAHVQCLLCFQGNRYDQEKLLKQSHTLYVGNLSFYTTEEQVGYCPYYYGYYYYYYCYYYRVHHQLKPCIKIGLILILFIYDEKMTKLAHQNICGLLVFDVFIVSSVEYVCIQFAPIYIEILTYFKAIFLLFLMLKVFPGQSSDRYDL